MKAQLLTKSDLGAQSHAPKKHTRGLSQKFDALITETCETEEGEEQEETRILTARTPRNYQKGQA